MSKNDDASVTVRTLAASAAAANCKGHYFRLLDRCFLTGWPSLGGAGAVTSPLSEICGGYKRDFVGNWVATTMHKPQPPLRARPSSPLPPPRR